MSEKGSGKNKTASSEEKEIERIVAGLDKETRKRLQELEEAKSIPKGSIEYDIFRTVDQLSMNIWNLREEIDARLTEMHFIRSDRRRMQGELAMGKITRELKPGIPMNEEELQTEIRRKDWQIREHAMAVFSALGKLRAFVGHLGVDGQVIMSQEAYEAFAKKSVAEVEGFGVKLRK